MPGAIESLILLGLTSAGLSAGALAIAVPALTYGVVGLIGVGIQLGVQSLLTPRISLPTVAPPKPEDVQQSARNPISPRIRHYGRVKVSGPWIFAENYQGSFYKLLALGQGPIHSIQEYWIDDTQVTMSGSTVTDGPWAGLVSIYTRLGVATETHYSQLTSIFPEWTSSHRGDGIVSLLVHQPPVQNSAYLSTFPNGIFTNYRLVLNGAMVVNPVTGSTGWNDNAAAVILDYMQHADGMRLPAGVFSTTQALSGWQAAYTKSAESIALKGGGTEDRYRLWGSYRLDERPADVLGRMLAACDGRLYPTADGGIALKVGEWAEPTVTLDDDSIVGFSELSRGRDILSTANTIRATYTDPTQDFQTADADPWVDAADVTDRGEIVADASFIMAPSHGQCRRLMKLAAYRANPNWVVSLECNVRGLAALAERFVRVQLPRFGIDEVFEVLDYRLVLAEGNILRGVSLQVQSMPSASYSWDADQEEGDAPENEETEVDDDIPLPTGFSATLFTKTIGGASVFYALLEFDAPPSPALRVQARGKLTSDSAWTEIAVAVDATSAESFALADGEEYEFQIRHRTTGLREGAWTASEIVTAI